MNDRRPARLVPSLWLLLPLLALIGLVVWLQGTDGAGDEGMNNVFSYGAVLLGGLLYLFWFVFASGQRAIVKLGVLVGLALVAFGLGSAIRLEGWTGAMHPVWRWSWEEAEDRAVAAADEAVPASGLVDLATRGRTDFPGYLGARRDGVVRDVALARSWDSTRPEILWRKPSGSGWAGFAVVNGVAVTLEGGDGQEHVVALDAATGAELWRTSYPSAFEHVMSGAGPHATPTIDEGLVYTQGALGDVLCLEGGDGSVRWRKDLRELYGIGDELEASTVQYGRSGSILVVGELAIVPVGGDLEQNGAGLVAFDKRSGELLWEGPPRAISHASPEVATLAGVEQLVVVNEDTVSGHALADGALLWEHPWPGTTAGDSNNSQPRAVDANGVLVSKGYGQGALLLDVQRTDAEAWEVEPRWASRRSLRTKLTSSVLREGHAYALSDGMLECVDLGNGRRVWKEGRYGHGQLLLVGDLLLVLSEEGELVLVEASPSTEGAVLGRLPVLEGKTWNTFALVGDLALVRNGVESAAVRLPLAGDGAVDSEASEPDAVGAGSD